MEPGDGGISWNKHFSLDLIIKPEKGDPGTLKVLVDADMPAHKHGMNTKPEMVNQGDMRHHVDGMLFHMKGDWVITVEVTSKGRTEKAEFPVHIK